MGEYIIATTIKLLVVTITGLWWILLMMEQMKKILKHINQNILDGDVMNMSLIITEGNYSALDTDSSLCNCYYNIIGSWTQI